MNFLLQPLGHWLQPKIISSNISLNHDMLFTRSNINTQNICIRNLHLDRVGETNFSSVIVDINLNFKM